MHGNATTDSHAIASLLLSHVNLISALVGGCCDATCAGVRQSELRALFLDLSSMWCEWNVILPPVAIPEGR